MVKIFKTARLPFNEIKGTMAQRFAKSDELCERFFQNLIDDFKVSDEVHVVELKHYVNQTLGKHVDISFLKHKEGETSFSAAVTNRKHEVLGYSINLPLNDKNKISLINVSSLMHEIRHVFDYLVAPKVITRQVAHSKSIPENILFKTVLENDKQFNPKELTSWLEHCFTPKEIFKKIDFLQACRSHFFTEKNAYGKELYYLEKYLKDVKNIDVEKLKNSRCEIVLVFNRYKDFLAKYNVDGKIEALNNELSKALNEAREMIKTKNSQQL